MQREYPSLLTGRYAPEGEIWELPMDNAQLLTKIAMARNLLKAGGEADYQRASKLVLDDFRNGKTGRISLEMPPQGGDESERK